MSGVQFGITIAACTAATMLTRFLPFLIFSSKDQQPPEVVRYLGRVLPPAVMGLLVVYCLRNIQFAAPPHGAAEMLSVAAVALLHRWRGNVLLSIAGGTVLYMVLVQTVFV